MGAPAARRMARQPASAQVQFRVVRPVQPVRDPAIERLMGKLHQAQSFVEPDRSISAHQK
jgi:hypothetical protein